MLQSFRERMQGIVAWTIVIAICITFALWGIQNYLHGSGNHDVAAKVNGTKITQKQLQTAYESLRREKAYTLGQDFLLDQKAQIELKKQVLQQLIKKAAFAQYANTSGFYVSLPQIRAIIYSLPAFQINGIFSPERYQQALSNFNYSEAALIEEFQKSVILKQLDEGIYESSFVLQNEVETAIKLNRQKRDFEYVVIEPKRVLKDVKITDEDVKNYYEKHNDNFSTPEQVSVEYIQLKADDLKNKISIDENALRQYYKEHANSYSAPTQWQIAQISLPIAKNFSHVQAQEVVNKLKTAAAKKDFEKIAKKQGKIFWTTLNGVSGEAASQMNKLSVGEFSKPFLDGKEYAVFKILKIRSAQSQSFEKNKEKIKSDFIRQQALQLFSEQSDKLVDLVYTNSDSLLPAANELGLKVKTTELFTKNGGKNGLTVNKKIVKSTYSDAVLRQGYNSNLIEIESGNVVVLRIKDHIPEQPIPLIKVQSEIKKSIEKEKMDKMANELSEQIVAEVSAEKPLLNIAKKHFLDFHKFYKIGREDKKTDAEILNLAFNLLPWKAEYVKLNDGSYAVVVMDKIYEGEAEQLSSSKKHDIQEKLAARYGAFDYYLMSRSIYEKAKVKTEDRALSVNENLE